MAVFKNVILQYLRFNNFFFHRIQTSPIHDRHFDYFRNKNEYRKSLVQLSNNCQEKILINSEFPFLKGKSVQVDEFLSHLTKRENVMKLSMTQLKDAVSLIANSKFDYEKYEDTLTYIDEKCAMSVDRWPLDFSMCVLDALFIILGPKVFRKHYYCALTNLLNKKMKKCSRNNLILILYFIGLSKKAPPFFMELIMYKLENFRSDLSDEEWAIACLSFFKTSTKMNSDLLLEKCHMAAVNLMLKNDNFNLIAVLKCLRLSEYFDEDLMRLLSEYVEKEYLKFNFVECTNFLATFATQNVYNYETYKCLEIQGVSQLSKEDLNTTEFNKNIERIHPSERTRVKDLARFLWAMAFVGHDINPKTINFILEILNARLSSGEFESNIPTLIDCLQSLILCGHYPSNMIQHVLKPASIEKLSVTNKAKPKYQLYFINRSAFIENCVSEIKNKFMNIPKSLEREVSERNGYQNLIDYLDIHLKENLFTCCYIMPHIMISGIVVATNPKNNSDKLITPTLFKLIEYGIISKSVEDILHVDKVYTCIELLDPSVCVRRSTMPLGLMKTKIHQLQKLNINVITLSSEEISSLIKSSDQSCCPKIQNIIM